MFCHHCGTELKPDTIFCHNCGIKVPGEVQQIVQPTEETAQTQTQSTLSQNPGRGFGIASLVLGLISFSLSFFCPCLGIAIVESIPLICGVIGIILGARGCHASKRAGFENTCAKVGLIVSVAGATVTILFCVFYSIIDVLEESIGAAPTYPSI